MWGELWRSSSGPSLMCSPVLVQNHFRGISCVLTLSYQWIFFVCSSFVPVSLAEPVKKDDFAPTDQTRTGLIQLQGEVLWFKAGFEPGLLGGSCPIGHHLLPRARTEHYWAWGGRLSSQYPRGALLITEFKLVMKNKGFIWTLKLVVREFST